MNTMTGRQTARVICAPQNDEGYPVGTEVDVEVTVSKSGIQQRIVAKRTPQFAWVRTTDAGHLALVRCGQTTGTTLEPYGDGWTLYLDGQRHHDYSKPEDALAVIRQHHGAAVPALPERP